MEDACKPSAAEKDIDKKLLQKSQVDVYKMVQKSEDDTRKLLNLLPLTGNAGGKSLTGEEQDKNVCIV